MPGCGVRFADCDIHHLWWWRLNGPTDLDLQLPLCRSHHSWLHEGGYTITRQDGLLVFRDPRGRTITNTTEVLSEQLDLLHQQHAQRQAAPQHAAGRHESSECDGWAATPYRSGAWGWIGPNPAPPPGHAPPTAN